MSRETGFVEPAPEDFLPATDRKLAEQIGREAMRLWQRAAEEHWTKGRLGDEVDKLMCWGPEAERIANRPKCGRCHATVAGLVSWPVPGAAPCLLCEPCDSFVRAAISGRPVFARGDRKHEHTESHDDEGPRGSVGARDHAGDK